MCLIILKEVLYPGKGNLSENIIMVYTWKTKPVKKTRQLEISGRKRLYKKQTICNTKIHYTTARILCTQLQ